MDISNLYEPVNLTPTQVINRATISHKRPCKLEGKKHTHIIAACGVFIRTSKIFSRFFLLLTEHHVFRC